MLSDRVCGLRQVGHTPERLTAYKVVMLKWTLRITITVIDLMLLAALWSVAGWPSPFTECDHEDNPVATLDDGEISAIMQMTGAGDEDMSGE